MPLKDTDDIIDFVELMEDEEQDFTTDEDYESADDVPGIDLLKSILSEVGAVADLENDASKCLGNEL